MRNAARSETMAFANDLDDDSVMLFRGLAFAAVGSLIPWGLLAYCLL